MADGSGRVSSRKRSVSVGAEIIADADGVVTVRLTGRLKESEVLAVQTDVAAVIRAKGNVRLLVLTEAFQGWERGREWSSFSFQEQYDPHIDRMAIVGEQQWEDSALMFAAKGLRPFPIEYFSTDELARAHAWVRAES